ncbi:spirocyclase AveC family protein [Williamsia sp. DF01-3]|uniref:spirocyclase AveC family protein n=1 Tax=Williamsia sp. DF01-3 TaxID=2934157 RepID=UPI001FF1EB76|nr:spirocyclase AveC family protein [Williamsia sp. DF01-3]MCK0519863.1 spirocyclase AveC family protein [Williamsia sp. DF01-3]
MSGPPVTSDTVPTHPGRTKGPLRPSKTALILAAVGLFFVAIQAYGYIAWLLADPAKQPEGNDPVPASVMANVDRAEAILIVLTVVWIAVLVFSCWRAKGLTWPLLLTFAWSAVYWQEPLVNALDHNFTYNAHLRDRGDWVRHLPFSPVDGPTLSQPLFEALVFFALLPIFGLLSYAILRGLHRIGLHPPLLLVLSVWLIFVVLDAAFEMAGIAQGLLVWNRVADNLAISAGTADQWPVYEGIMLGFLWALPGMLMFFRGDHRFSVLDPGIDVLPGALPVVVRLLALAGLLNVAFLAYNIALMVLSGSTVAPAPSWLSP